MSLQDEIIVWDGKSASDIDKLFRSYSDDSNFIQSVISLLKEISGQKGASWLLKAWFENGYSVEPEQSSEIIDSLPMMETWETKLHVLQCLPYVSILIKKKFVVEDFVRASLKEKNKFVRAWAYNGFYELAKQHPEYRAEATALFNAAIEHEAASVKARIRHIVKSGF